MRTKKERRLIATAEEARAFATQEEGEFRRPLKPQPKHAPEQDPNSGRQGRWFQWHGFGWVESVGPSDSIADYCPFGPVGQRLWAAETWAPVDFMEVGYEREEAICVGYAATTTAISHETGNVHMMDVTAWNWDMVSWSPASKMPRWASRSLVEVTSVRVECREGVWEWVAGWKKVAEEA